MNIFRVHRLPLFQVPETQSGEPVLPVDPAVIATTERTAVPDDPAQPSPAPELAKPSEPPASESPEPSKTSEPSEHGNKGKKPWYMARISEESERARQAEERVRAAEELVERLRKGDASFNPQISAAPSESDIEARASQLAEQRLNSEKIRSVITSGLSDFSDWNERAEMLGALGAASPAFVLDVVSVDPANAHKILHQLADDPQKAAHLAKMDGRTRVVELVKLSLALQSPATETRIDPKPAKTISKAPAPPPAIEPGTAQAVDWRSDKVSDADFSKGWEENARLRASRR